MQLAGSWPVKVGAQWPERTGGSNAALANWSWFAGRPWVGQLAFDLAQAANQSFDADPQVEELISLMRLAKRL